jgi:hypothetical protein
MISEEEEDLWATTTILKKKMEEEEEFWRMRGWRRSGFISIALWLHLSREENPQHTHTHIYISFFLGHLHFVIHTCADPDNRKRRSHRDWGEERENVRKRVPGEIQQDTAQIRSWSSH